MEKKQSSIDYFFEEVVKWQMKPWLYASDGLEPIIKQAKAMHKEERLQDFKEGFQAALESLQGANNLVQSKKLGGNNE